MTTFTAAADVESALGVKLEPHDSSFPAETTIWLRRLAEPSLCNETATSLRDPEPLEPEWPRQKVPFDFG